MNRLWARKTIYFEIKKILNALLTLRIVFAILVSFPRPFPLGVRAAQRATRLQRVQSLGYLFGPSTIDQLVYMQRCSAMRTLRALLGKPSMNACVAAKF